MTMTMTVPTQSTAETQATETTRWRRWTGRVTAVLSACWHRVSDLFGGRRASAGELRSAEKLRRKEIRRKLKQGRQ